MIDTDNSPWHLGYFAAVAAYVRENCDWRSHDSAALSLFLQGGDYRHALPSDIEVFRSHGLIDASERAAKKVS